MEPLDAGQQAELDELLRTNGWVRRTVPVRLVMLLLMTSPMAVLVGGVAAMAGPGWPVVTAVFTALFLAVLTPHVVAPERVMRAQVRMWTVRDADAARWRGPGMP